jgi:hypothetical protein
MPIPHLKLTKTNLEKFIIDAKKSIREQFRIEPDESDGVETWEEPIYRVGCYGLLNMDDVLIKFYMTKRGDKRMSIPKLNKVAEAGDYVWFTVAEDGETIYYNIHIGKELPFDSEQYEQIKERFG